MTRELERNDGEFVDVPEEPQDPINADEQEQLDRLDDLLGRLQANQRILIERLQPSWCSGFLEEVTLTEQIGLDYFIDTWGGHLLSVKVRGTRGRLKGSYKIPLYSFPPLRYGEPISQSNKGDRFKTEESAPPAPNQPVVVNPGNPFEKLFTALPTVLPLVFDYMRSQEQKRQADFQMMVQMMKQNSGGGLADITKVGAVMTQLNDMFKQNAGIETGNGEIDFIPHALEVMKMVLGNQSQAKPQPQPQAPRLAAPRGGPPRKPIRSESVPPNVTPLKRDLAAELSEMEPTQAAQMVMNALGRMSPDKRDAAMGTFVAQMNEDLGDDGFGGFDDDDYDDSDETGVSNE